ncbi:MAG: CheY-like receiver and HTH DNA-binding domain-containing response [Geobacteraceae bacterium]|nr:MAG: CheY-like receiver and HTH DNA-binding domain-containing response [Geobacteraceae bacterium]
MRIVIVEDNRLLRENLSILLAGEPGITVAGAFGSAEDTLAGLGVIEFDIVLVDLDLPGMNGVELIRRIRRFHPDSDIMVHTIFEDRDTVFSALKAGATGYILKGSTPRILVESLESLHNGGAPMSPKIARKVIHEFQSREQGSPEDRILSSREKSVVKGLEHGMSYKEIADRLCISPHTVHTHIKNIYEKLQAKDRPSALLTARKRGLI